MVRLEHIATTKADSMLAWKLFSNWKLWPRFSDIYGDIEWLSGKPWSIGSRLKIDIVKPIRTSVDHVITVCSPGECVAWIDHFLGHTMEQWVLFEPLVDGGTQVRTWAELLGTPVTVTQQPIAAEVKNFIERWYNRFCAECDQALNNSARA